MKPCRDCSIRELYELDEEDGGGCATSYCCSDYIEWQVEVAWRVQHEREADPRVERGVDYMIDDREM